MSDDNTENEWNFAPKVISKLEFSKHNGSKNDYEKEFEIIRHSQLISVSESYNQFKSVLQQMPRTSNILSQKFIYSRGLKSSKLRCVLNWGQDAPSFKYFMINNLNRLDGKEEFDPKLSMFNQVSIKNTMTNNLPNGLNLTDLMAQSQSVGVGPFMPITNSLSPSPFP